MLGVKEDLLFLLKPFKSFQFTLYMILVRIISDYPTWKSNRHLIFIFLTNLSLMFNSWPLHTLTFICASLLVLCYWLPFILLVSQGSVLYPLWINTFFDGLVKFPSSTFDSIWTVITVSSQYSFPYSTDTMQPSNFHFHITLAPWLLSPWLMPCPLSPSHSSCNPLHLLNDTPSWHLCWARQNPWIHWE